MGVKRVGMKLAYATIKNARQLGKGTEWSGTGYHIAQSIESHDVLVDYLGPLKDDLPMKAIRKLKRHYYQLFDEVYFKDPDPAILRRYAAQVSKKLSDSSHDVVLSATVNPIAYLDCSQPILFWADATFQNTAEFYPKYSNLCDSSKAHGHEMERRAIEKCKFAIYSSDWAAKTAIDFYNADPEKVKVIPFGSNLVSSLTEKDVDSLVQSRSQTTCKLIFIGVDWTRKGGDKALAVARALNEAGLPTELTLVGCQPSDDAPLPGFVRSMGYISKLTKSGQEKISRLISESHFLILPTLADCSPIVLCEANAFGVPCLTTNLGGIPTIIKSNVNGELFEAQANAVEYCQYVTDVFSDYDRYREMAHASFRAYEQRLNWDEAGRALKALIAAALE